MCIRDRSYTLQDRKRNAGTEYYEYTRSDCPISDRMVEYLNRMDECRIPRQPLDYTPKVRTGVRRPKYICLGLDKQFLA